MFVQPSVCGFLLFFCCCLFCYIVAEVLLPCPAQSGFAPAHSHLQPKADTISQTCTTERQRHREADGPALVLLTDQSQICLVLSEPHISVAVGKVHKGFI